jgi:hypothetical protein
MLNAGRAVQGNAADGWYWGSLGQSGARHEEKTGGMRMTFPIRIFIDSPDGLLAFGRQYAGVPLPWGLDAEGPAVTYGTYFEALTNFLSPNGYQPLCTALSQLLERPVPLQEILELSIISQKHGAFYHVAQVRAKLAEQHYSLAVNSAVHPVRQAFLDHEFALFQDLNKRFPLGFIPRVSVLGSSSGMDENGSHVTIRSFVAEWFEGYHEFHLAQPGPESTPSIEVWDGHGNRSVLTGEESRSLYHQAALILTAYYHAAGDFILKRQATGLQLRQISVRGYLSLVSVGPDPADQWLPLVHFFLNLSLRMRLDRLDGTGKLVWAGAECLQGVVSGFLEGWEQKAEKDATLPRRSGVIAVLRSFTAEEWLSLVLPVLEDGLEEADELEFFQPRLKEHVHSLFKAVRENTRP